MYKIYAQKQSFLYLDMFSSSTMEYVHKSVPPLPKNLQTTN